MGKGIVKSDREVELIRESCRIVAEVIRLLGSAVRPGVTTAELDRMAEEYIRAQGARPAFKGYGSDKSNPFPASICASVDNQVVHGIPDRRELRDGEIVSIDVGVERDGYFGDGAWTFAVGRAGDEKLRLMEVTEEALRRGVSQARAGNCVHDISAAVQEYVEANGFSVVKELVGHGVGRMLHEEPAVPNFVLGRRTKGDVLQVGMTLAIEPMVNMGADRVQVARDGWTVMTGDGLPSAHFEHTVLITEGEPEILTR
jgi:methionyl aminopeptidase